MKLHLPKLLRNSVLACIAAVAGVAGSTVGTATFAGGVVAFVLSGQASGATYTNPAAAFANGDVLELGDGASVDNPLSLDSADSSITLNVTDGTVTWATSQGENKGVSTVNIASGATLDVTADDGQYCVFASKQDSIVTINLEANATMKSNNIFGWDNQARGNGTRVVNMGAGSEWTINDGVDFYLNNTTINLSGGTIVLGEGTNMWFERRSNAIVVSAEATQMSVISGTGHIKLGNNGVEFESKGYRFDVNRGAFDFDDTNTADLQLSAILENSGHGMQKTGDGVMEITSDNSSCTASFFIRGGEVKITGSGNHGSTNMQVESGAILTLATSAPLAGSINLQDGGTLKISADQQFASNAVLNGTVEFTNTVTLNGGATTIDENTAIIDLTGWTGGDTYQLFTLNGGTLTGAKVQVAGYTGDGTWVLDNTGLLTLQSSVTWSGGATLTWAEGSSFDGGVKYTNNSLVVFAGSQGDVTATVDGAVIASELTVEAGTNLILAGTGTVTSVGTVLEGDLTVGTAGNSLGSVTMSEGSKLTIAVEGETTLTDSIGTTNISGGTIYVGEGCTLKETTSGFLGHNITVQGTLSLGAGDVVNYGVGSPQIITIDGGTLELGEFRQSFSANNKLVLNNATVTGAGDQHGAIDFFQNGGTITSSGNSTIEAPIRLRNANEVTNVDVVDGTLTVSSFCNVGGGASGNLNKIGAGTLALSGTVETRGTVNVSAGMFKMLDGAVATSAVNLSGGTLGAEGTSTMASLTGTGDIVVDAGAALTISNATALFNKKGEGSLVIETLTATTLNMNYEGPLTINTLSLAANAVLSYSDAAGGNVLKIDSLASNVVVNVFAMQGQLQSGIDLGLASSIEADKITVLGLDAGEYTLEESNGYWTLISDVELHTDWDMNWGSDVIATSPAAMTEIAVAADATDFSLASTAANNQAGMVVAKLTGGSNNACIYGGSLLPNGASSSFTGNTWLFAEEGQYKLITGGHFANSWSNGTVGHFTGDTHIVVDGATVGSIVGGSHQDGQRPVFTGNSYISIFSGNVTAAIVGAGTNAHGSTTSFVGTTNIFVYVPLNTNGENGMGGAAPGDAVIGAGTSFDPQSRGCTNNLTGTTNVTVDLSEYSGDAANFSKKVIGGHFNWSGSYTANIEGNTNVNIIGNSTVTFTDTIVGGTRNNGATINTSGISTVTISGDSTFSSLVVGGSYLSGNSTSATGGTQLSISGGTFSGAIYGGAYHENAGTSTTGDVVISLAGGTFAGRVVAGSHLETQTGSLTVGNTSVTVSGEATELNGDLIGGLYINGTGEANVTASMGDSTITVSGGKVTNVYGGTYTVRNKADVTITQGNIVIDLQGGEIAGDVYAAGYQGNATSLTTESTTVNLSAAVTIADGKVISGGYKTSQTNSVVTGDRTLAFTGTQDRTGVSFVDFDKVIVAENAKVTVGALPTGDLTIDKEGAGTLATTVGVASTGAEINVNEGTLLLSGTASLSDSNVNVAADAVLEIATTGEIVAADATIAGSGSLVKNDTGSATLGALGSEWTGAVTVNGGTLNLSSIESAASVEVKAGAAMNVAGNVACEVTNSGALTATGISGKLTSTGGSIELTGDGAAITSSEISLSGTTLKGTWSATGAKLATGVVVDTTGTVTLTAADLGGMVTITGGTLVLAGETTLSGFTSTENITYDDDTKNGFAYTSDVYAGVISLGDNGSLDTTGMTVDGYAVTLKSGDSLVADHGLGTVYWVSSGVVSYDDSLNLSNAEGVAATGFKLSGGELVIGKELGGLGIDVASTGGNITIAAGQTLTAAALSGDGVAQLGGSGSYDIGNGLTLGSNAALAESWAGVVKTSVTEVSADTQLALGDQVEFTADTLTLGGDLSMAGKLTIGKELIFASCDSLLSVDALAVRGGALAIELDDSALLQVAASSSTLIELEQECTDKLTYGGIDIDSNGTMVQGGVGMDSLYDVKLSWNGKVLVLSSSLREDVQAWGDEDVAWDSSLTDEETTMAFIGGGSGTIEITGGTATVKDIVVSNHGDESSTLDYTFIGEDVEAKGDLSVNYGTSLTVSNTTTVDGSATVNADSALNVSEGELNVKGNIESGDGSIAEGGSIVVEDGQLSVGGSMTAGSISVAENGTLLVSSDVKTSSLVNASTVEAGNVTVTSLVNTGDFSAKGVVLASAPKASSADKPVALGASGEIQNSGNMTVGGVDASSFVMTGGTLEITTDAGFASANTEITGGTLKADVVDWGIDGGQIGGVTIEGDKKITLSNVSLTDTLVNNGNLELSGTVDLSALESVTTDVFTNLDGKLSEAGNGYASYTKIYTIVTGNDAVINDVEWLSADAASYEYNSGILTEKHEYSMDVYVVNEDMAYNSEISAELADNNTTSINAKGGKLDVLAAMGQKLTVDGAEVDVKATVSQAIALNSGLLNINAAINGIESQGGTINIDDAATGEVKVTGSKATITGGNGQAVLAVASGVEADLTLGSTTVKTDTKGVTLNGTLTEGVLSVAEGTVLAGNLAMDSDSTLRITSSKTGLVLSDSEVETASSSGIISVGDITIDGDIEVVGAASYDKYFSGWVLEENADGSNVVVALSRNYSYYTDKASESVSSNGAAGLVMADAALVELNPQVDKKSDLGTVLSLLDKAGSEAADELGASLAGASTAVLGMAAMGDVDRQLQAIRNRTTTMGVDQSTVREGMPYFNAWINAEGDFSELADDGTASGYQISSWGGTVGFDVDLLPELTAGVALTAMHGDLDASGADKATGKLDTQYLSIFARYAPSAWTHTFVGTIGQSSISLDRTVAGIQTQGETDGMSFGLMYEAGRVYSLNEDGTTCLQPVFNVTWKHTAVDGYTENGSDIALNVDDQTLDTVTFGLGARVQTVVGESMYNRTSILEARVLAKLDAGDRQGNSDVALSALPDTRTSVESAEMGAFGLEIGAGLTVPVGDVSGSIFADASLELRSDYTNVNGTIGYRVNF